MKFRIFDNNNRSLNKRQHKNISLSLFIISVFFSGTSIASDCKEIANITAKKLQDNYVIEDVATKLVVLLHSNSFLTNCSQQNSEDKIAEFITLELNKIAKDKHLSLTYDPQWVKELRIYRASDQSKAFADSRVMELPRDNYGFKKIEMLEGNIGYLDIRAFADSHLGGETLESAMRFLQYSDGIIIDLRNNFGGSPFMVTTLASYFFDLNTVHLSSFESREAGELTVTQEWSSPYVPGPRFKDTPLYILTSKKSASAAEGFSYIMKNLNRAILVGEVTAGSAHGRRAEIIDDNYILTLPTSRPIDPRTHDNWENKGVTPHIATTSDYAFYQAYADILKTLIQRPTDNVSLHQWVYPLIKARSSSYKPNQEDISKLVGSYGKRKIYQENGKLIYQYLEEPGFEVELLDKETIVFKAFNESRLQVVYKNNRVTAIKMLSFGGNAREFQKTL